MVQNIKHIQINAPALYAERIVEKLLSYPSVDIQQRPDGMGDDASQDPVELVVECETDTRLRYWLTFILRLFFIVATVAVVFKING